MSKTNETMQPEAVETGTLKLDVTVRPIAPKENLIGFANVTFNDSFVVEGFRICTGSPERIQFFEEKSYRHICTTEERCVYSS